MTDKASTESGEDWDAVADALYDAAAPCHVCYHTYPTQQQVATALRHAFTQGERKGIERAAAWHDAEVSRAEDGFAREPHQPMRYYHLTEFHGEAAFTIRSLSPTQDEKKGGAE